MTQTEQTSIQESRADQFIIQTFEGLSGLEELADEWASITDSLENQECFHLIDWYRCYFENLSDQSEKAFFILISEGDQPLAIFPFFSSVQKLGLIRNRILGLPKHLHIPFGDFIIRQDAEFQSLFKALLDELRKQKRTAWDSFLLPRLFEESPVAGILNTEPVPGMFTISYSVEPCDYIPVKPYEELFQGLSSKMRSNLRRSKKRAMQLDHFQYDHVTDFPELEKAFEEFLTLEASSWKGKEELGTAIQLNPQLVSYYRSLMESYSRHGSCSIHLLRDGDRPICAVFGLVTDKTFYGLKIAYDEEFKGLSPGNLIHEYILKTYAEQGVIKRLNMTSHTPWQRSWQPLQIESFEVMLLKKNLKGTFLFALIKTRNYLRALKKKWREKHFVNSRGQFRPRSFL